MTIDSRVAAITHFGFTERQARFLVLVMLHAGVCLDRQYCMFARISHGRAPRLFFQDLVARRFATAYPCGHNRAWIYHVQNKTLYRAIDEQDSRLRRPAYLGRAVERLMLLDAVLLTPSLTWLATEREKVAHFTLRLRDRLDPADFPSLVFGGGTTKTTRYFTDRLPIGVEADGDSHVFPYLVTKAFTSDFRAFLQRHAELLRALPRWTIQLLVPRHRSSSASRYCEAFWQELATPLSPAAVDELRWYFHQRRSSNEGDRRARDTRYLRCQKAFAAPRFWSLFSAWQLKGDGVLDAARSPAIKDALGRGTGRLDTHVLPHAYHHLLPLVGTA